MTYEEREREWVLKCRTCRFLRERRGGDEFCVQRSECVNFMLGKDRHRQNPDGCPMYSHRPPGILRRVAQGLSLV